MRGVPRERQAISAMPSLSSRTPRIAAERLRIFESAAAVVEIQPKNLAETIAQRRSQKARAGRRADQGKAFERQLDRARGRPLADHDIDLIILHRRIENFFDDVIQPVDFIDEKDIALFEIGQEGGKIARALDHRTGSGFDAHAHLAPDDVGERGFPQPGRTVKKDMVEHVVARLRRRNGDPEIFLDRLLADVFVKAARP